MTDHRTTAEQLIDAADPTSPHTRDRTLTDAALVRAVLAVADAIDAHGTREHVIDHAVLQQHSDRARAAFPGTDSRPTTPRLRYHGQTVETKGSTLDATPFTAIHVDTISTNTQDPRRFIHHTNEGGDTSALAADVRGDTIVPATQPANGTEDPLWRLRLLAGTARRAVNEGPIPGVITLHDLVQDIAVHLGHLIEQSGELQASVSGQRVLMDSYERQIRALAQQNGQLRDQRDRESEARAEAQDKAVDPDLHEQLRRMTNRLRRALGNLDIGAELPFNDVVSDLRHHVDAVVEELNEARG
ncbi:hypothetical protein KNU20_gp58 [Gordonia phage Geodirt]|uniref:Uncharacterized protein n=1 Tax=Gordonia phage Geodirt TaxID=2483670 RepID=A0A3G3M934_9CAUD|nr:hypothetical protein KNU20_gp58 [Gordonia phage Geodirt]AYR02951.1 hypothetical protein SEA_GEODIRT_58 [Gordonia phage Geodirt]